ncbi:MAG: hypothetical protein O2923_02780 [Verrucomicrobia bacterium]|nr:hypothetical protein [Verrucomicrobiota bacterium]MDA1086572.1 hypothetical protein [Verrucomicrobiota bacterium]
MAKITDTDRSIVRSLAERVREIAGDPVHAETAAAWTRLNGLQAERPLIWINEIPWHEMELDRELKLTCEDAFCRGVENRLRRTIYEWEHLPADMVVEAIYSVPLVVHDSGFNMCVDSDFITQHQAGGIVSQGYHSQFQDVRDLEKIQFPELQHDAAASERNVQQADELLGDILEVRACGIVHSWFAPWDVLVTWWGVEQAMMDLVMKPELVHAAMERLTQAYLERLRQWQELNVLSVTSGNYRVGSGGLAYTNELPAHGFDAQHVRPLDQWGCGTAQIFTGVSPAMHEEFAFAYEKKWMEQFGLTYYGCCDVLHDKVAMLAALPNLRKVSMSPLADLDKAVENLNGRYVISHKPNPAIFAADHWNLAQARENLERALEQTQGCVVEIIMKDVSTVREEPQRLWEWAAMASEVVRKRFE